MLLFLFSLDVLLSQCQVVDLDTPIVGKDHPPHLAFLVPSQTPKKVTQNQAYDNNHSLVEKKLSTLKCI